MKKNLLLLATLVFGAFAFTACGDDDDNGGSKNVWDNTKNVFEKAANSQNSLSFTSTDNSLMLDVTPGGTCVLGYDPDEFVIKDLKVRGLGYTVKGAVEKDYYVGVCNVKVTLLGYEITIPGVGVITIKDGEGSTKTAVIALEGGSQLEKQVKESGEHFTDVTSQDVCRTWEVEATKFTYTEYEVVNGELKAKNPIGAEFAGCDLVEMGEWLKKKTNGDVDIVETLAAKKSIEFVDFSDHGTFSIKMGDGDACVGKWNWYNEKLGVLNFSWYSEDMHNSFENGTAVVEPVKGKKTNFLRLTLEGAVLDMDKAKPYKVKLVTTMTEKK